MTRSTHPPRLLAALLAVSVLSAPLAGTAAALGGSASFADNTITVTRGDTVEVTVTHSDTAHLYVGSERSGFLLEIVLAGEGTDTVTIDTFATTEPPAEFVSGSTNVTLHTNPLRQPLAATTYLMNVTVGGVEQDIGSFTVEPRGEMNATTMVAPAALLDADTLNASDVVATATRRQMVAHGDLAVINIDETGLENAVNPTDLDGDARANGVAIRFTELDPEPNTDTDVFWATTVPGITVLTDFPNDRIVLVWNTAARALVPRSNHTWQVDVILYAEHNGLVDTDTVVASTRVHIVRPSVDVSGASAVARYPWEEATVTVSGTTNLAPGTVLNVRARNERPPFLAQRDVTVAADGTFSTTLDVSRAPPGRPVPVWVLGWRDETDRTVTRYVERARLTFEDQVSSGAALLAQSVHLGAGGFVVLRANGSTVGISDYLAPGTHEDVTIWLADPFTEEVNVTAVVHLDRNLDRRFDAATDRAYRRDGTGNETVPVRATAFIRLQGTGIPTPTPPTTTRPPATSTPTPPTTTATTPMTHTTTHLAASGPLVEPTPLPAIAAAESSVGVPLSGWTAVVAFVAAGVLSRRRGGESA